VPWDVPERIRLPITRPEALAKFQTHILREISFSIFCENNSS
jgi:hypothetical protein